MKKVLILFPVLTLLITGCSLTQKAADNSLSIQSASLSQEQSDNLDTNVSATTPNKNEELDNVSETLVNTPAEIKSIFVKNKITYLSIDILSRNPEFLPGVTEFFVNESTRLTEVHINNNTKAYLCGAGPDGNDTTADVLADTNDFLATIQKKLSNKEYSTYYFDINSNIVQSIYGQCLP